MNNKIIIDHTDIAHLGYYFLKKKDEQIFLNVVNEELRDRINKKMQQMDESDTEEQSNTTKILELENRIFNTKIVEIRIELIEELRRKRKEVILNDLK